MIHFPPFTSNLDEFFRDGAAPFRNQTIKSDREIPNTPQPLEKILGVSNKIPKTPPPQLPQKPLLCLDVLRSGAGAGAGAFDDIPSFLVEAGKKFGITVTKAVDPVNTSYRQLQAAYKKPADEPPSHGVKRKIPSVDNLISKRPRLSISVVIPRR